MTIELTKKQILNELDELIVYEFSTEEYEKFILKHIKNYAKFDDAYFDKICPLVEKLKKKTDKQYDDFYGTLL